MAEAARASDSRDGPDELARLADRSAAGDRSAWGELLNRCRGPLRRMVELRIDERIRGRLDASDVVQEAFITASMRLAEFSRTEQVPVYIWLRELALQQLALAHRRHLSVRMRDARREVSLEARRSATVSSLALAAMLVGREPAPPDQAIRAERRRQVEASLASMSELDRDVLAMRHFEQLTTAEVALVMGMTPAAAAKRYLRALKKLKGLLFPAVENEVNEECP